MTPPFLSLSDSWRQTYPGAGVSVLIVKDVINLTQHAGLDERKLALETHLRERYSGYDRPALRALPQLQAYHQFYRRFDKTYHVQLQLESVIFKGKPISSATALVEAMFMAELNHFLLTAGHDLEAVRGLLRAGVAQGSETFIQISGREVQLKPGDLYIADEDGILSTVLSGPDQRTQITTSTVQVVYTTYIPAGISDELALAHLHDIARNIQVFAPQATIFMPQVYR